MNKYITIGGYILEWPVLLAILSLLLVSAIVFVIFFFSFSPKPPSFKKKLVFSVGLVVVCLIAVVIATKDETLQLDHTPQSLSTIHPNPDLSNAASFDQKQRYKYRYTISERLDRLGFIKTIYDDGGYTYFVLNSPKVPTIFIENDQGDLVDQSAFIVKETLADHPFPVLKADTLATVWYLQFNNFVSHIKQVPDFKRSRDGDKVDVFYSDRLFGTLEVFKDRFICDQRSPQDKNLSTPRARHYFVFEAIRYYMDNCFVDQTSE